MILQARKTAQAAKRQLFGLSSDRAFASLEALGREQFAKYGHLGLRHVPAQEMPAAIDDLFARLDYRPRERLLEIGAGANGGLALVAALSGVDATILEYDRPFVVNVDALKQQLSASSGTEAALAQIAGMSGSIEVSQIENLRRGLASYQPLIDAVGGSLRVLPGDFADTAVQDRLADDPPFDHVVCTDVISPLHGTLGHSTAMLTTGEDAKVRSMIDGLARVAARGRTLLMAMLVPEQSTDFASQIAHLYGALESALTWRGRTFTHEHVISPSSGTVQRARLYHLSSDDSADNAAR